MLLFVLGIVVGCFCAIPITILTCRSSYRNKRKSAFNLELEKELEQRRKDAERYYGVQVALLESKTELKKKEIEEQVKELEDAMALKRKELEEPLKELENLIALRQKVLDETMASVERASKRCMELRNSIEGLDQEYEVKKHRLAQELTAKADEEAQKYLHLIDERKKERFAAIVKRYEDTLKGFFDGLSRKKETAERELVELLDRIAILRASEIT